MSYYAVKIGKKPGVYLTWDECLSQTKGVSGAQYKKFNTEEEACDFAGVRSKLNQDSVSDISSVPQIGQDSELVAYVDGSYQERTQTVGYGVVVVQDNRVIIRDLGRFNETNFNTSRNVFGEVRGALKAVELALANGWKNITVAYDYEGIEKWAVGAWKANTALTRDYQLAMQRYMGVVNVTFKKVKAHASEAEGGSRWNVEADRLAKRAVAI